MQSRLIISVMLKIKKNQKDSVSVVNPEEVHLWYAQYWNYSIQYEHSYKEQARYIHQNIYP